MDGENRYIKKSSELKVGDIIEVSSGENVPADCLLMASMYSWVYLDLERVLSLSKLISLTGKQIGS